MKRLKVKRLTGFTLALICVLSILFPISASAGSHYFFYDNGGHLTNGVGDWGRATQYYYIADSASDEATHINAAMDTWIYTDAILSTPVSFRKTTTQASSIIDFHEGNYFPDSDDCPAATYFYNGSSSVYPDAVTHYYWAKIKLNAVDFNPMSNFDQQGTSAHEIGHAFGLEHNNTEPDSIMCQLYYDRYVNKPDYGSLAGVYTIYELRH